MSKVPKKLTAGLRKVKQTRSDATTSAVPARPESKARKASPRIEIAEAQVVRAERGTAMRPTPVWPD